MKKQFLLVLLFFFLVLSIISRAGNADELNFGEFQNHGEIYFRFEKPSPEKLSQLASVISIDRTEPSQWIYAYAVKAHFDAFVESGIHYEALVHPSSLVKPKMLSLMEIREKLDWDFYPSYEAYVAMMYQFEADYPGLCRIVNIGQSVEGRDLLFAVISDNVAQSEGGEPQLMYTSSMHGDEITGYVVSLRLIDYLLSRYATQNDIHELVNNTESWINPLANPDGTYASGNSTVSGATRFNSHGVDLNRNYPDPDDGPHPDGNAYQPETEAFMALAGEQHFTLSANFHGGSEVFNYPWDTYYELNPDTDWWIYVGRQWADTAQFYGPNGYMNDLDNGITNGYAWYPVEGGRQDYMNYYHHCREVTVEISTTKLPPASQLPIFWEANYRSWINFLKQGMYGFRGQVSDSASGAGITASVFIENHDEMNTWVASNNPGAWYFRPVIEGYYDLTFFAPGYSPKTISGLDVYNNTVSLLNVQLSPSESAIEDILSKRFFEVGPNPLTDNLSIRYLVYNDHNFDIAVYSASGKKLFDQTLNSAYLQNRYILHTPQLSKGIYYLAIRGEGQQQVWKLIKK